MKKAALRETHDTPLAALEPRHPTLWASLTLAPATLTLTWPGLTGQILFNPRSDQFTNGYGFRHLAEAWLRDGRGFPQWNPFLQGGVPYLAGMHGDVFYPTSLLRMMGTAEAITWEFPIHIFLAGLFTYLLLRAWRLPFAILAVDTGAAPYNAVCGTAAYNFTVYGTTPDTWCALVMCIVESRSDGVRGV